MRSDKVGYAPYLGVFLRELEDKMEVAKVQEQILETIINLQDQIPNAREAIAALNSGLFEISQVILDYIIILHDSIHFYSSYMKILQNLSNC